MTGVNWDFVIGSLAGISMSSLLDALFPWFAEHSSRFAQAAIAAVFLVIEMVAFALVHS